MSWEIFFKLADHIPNEDALGMKREFAGMVVNVENPAGTIRMGLDPDGHEWRIDMQYDYGFIAKVKGEDGEGLDVYLGPDQEAENVYVVHQVVPDTGEYDEDKCMLGWTSAKEAKEAYLAHYDSPDFFGEMTTLPLSEFKKAVEEEDATPMAWKKKKKKS